MMKLILFALALSAILTTHIASAQTYGRKSLHHLDNELVIRTPDSVKFTYTRLVQLLEADGYQIKYEEKSKFPRHFSLTASRVVPELPEFTVEVTFLFYKRRKCTCLNILGSCEGPGKFKHRRIFYNDDPYNKYGPTLSVLWKEFLHASTLYPSGTLTYFHSGIN